MDHDPQTGRLRDIGDDGALLGVGDGTPQHNMSTKKRREGCMSFAGAVGISTISSPSIPTAQRVLVVGCGSGQASVALPRAPKMAKGLAHPRKGGLEIQGRDDIAVIA